MSASKYKRTLDSGADPVTTLRTHADALLVVGAPDDEWSWSEGKDAGCESAMKKLQGTQALDVERRDNRSYCELSEQGKEAFRDIIENRETYMPCGHGGVRNTGSGYVCLYEPCDRVATREEVDV